MLERRRGSIRGDGNGSELAWLVRLSDSRTLVSLLDLSQKIVAVVERGNAPAPISAKTAHNAPRVNDCAGCLQVFTPIGNGRGLPFFQSDFGVIPFAAPEGSLDFALHPLFLHGRHHL